MHSPCIGYCVLDDSGVCEGCGRTGEQIVDWQSLSPEERRRICQQLSSDDESGGDTDA